MDVLIYVIWVCSAMFISRLYPVNDNKERGTYWAIVAIIGFLAYIILGL